MRSETKLENQIKKHDTLVSLHDYMHMQAQSQGHLTVNL